MKTSPKRAEGHAQLAVLAAVLAFSVGVAVALSLVRPLVSPDWAASQGHDRTVQPSLAPYLDERAVPATAHLAPEWDAKAPMGGVLRETTCKTGVAFDSGAAPFLINDVRPILLHLQSPPWRDFQYGLRGSDVLALQEELGRLGFFTGTADGYFGAQTGKAVMRLRASAGDESGGQSLPLSHILWLPSAQVNPTSCPVKLGDAIGAGVPLFSTGGTLSRLVLNLPEMLSPGARSAVVGSKTAPVPEDLVISDPEFLAEFTKAPRYQAFVKDPSKGLTVDVRLNKPIQVVALPASALYDIDSPAACVLSGNTAVEVQIIASQFGNTFVVPGIPLGAVALNPPKDAPACR